MGHQVGRSNLRSSSQDAIYIAYVDPTCDQNIGELKAPRNELALVEPEQNNDLYEVKRSLVNTTFNAEPHVLLNQMLHNIGELCAPGR